MMWCGVGSAARLLVVGVVTVLAALSGLATPAHASTPAKAAPPPLTVSILTSSRTDRCFDNGDIAAISRLANRELERINRSTEYNGRTFRLEFLDDQRDPQKAIANVRGALANPMTVALLGLANSATAKTLFETAGKEIRERGIPFISDISVNSLFADYNNVFTTRASQDEERLPVLRRFLKAQGAQKPAFIGLRDALFSAALVEGLKGGEVPPLVADVRLSPRNDKLEEQEVVAAIRQLKEKEADFLFLSIGSNRAGSVLQKMMAAGVRPPVVVTGRIDLLLAATPELSYSNDIHYLAFDGLPEAFNERLRQRISRTDPASWDFEGREIKAAPGWRSGECKTRARVDKPDLLRAENMRAIGVGTQYGDMVSLIAEALRNAPLDAEVPKLRRHLIEQLLTTYADGHGTFRGNFENWSFNTNTRSAARTPLIVSMKAGQRTMQLAQTQYVRLRNSGLRPVQTLYLDIDMIRTFRVEDNEKSFFADFYLSMHHDDGGAGINQIEFANAFLDPQTQSRQITIRPLHEGGKSATYPADMKVYRITGKFMFEPRLSNFPFDTQRFSIDLQPKLGDAPFIIQPPPAALRDQRVDSDGWEQAEQYVGYDEDFIRLVDAKSSEQSVVPFYKGSFVWIMKRQANDYYQRVVVPLAFILVVAYLSIFIPRTHFEAVVTIQVTALLSAVALYLALPKIDSDTATFSDRIFLFVYLAVSVMIAISIARVNPLIKGNGAPRVLAMMHILGIPAMVVVMALIVTSASVSDGHSWTAAWKVLTGKG